MTLDEMKQQMQTVANAGMVAMPSDATVTEYHKRLQFCSGEELAFAIEQIEERWQFRARQFPPIAVWLSHVKEYRQRHTGGHQEWASKPGCPICDGTGWISATRIDGTPTSVRCGVCKKDQDHQAMTYDEAVAAGRIFEIQGVYERDGERFLPWEEAKVKLAEIKARLDALIPQKTMKSGPMSDEHRAAYLAAEEKRPRWAAGTTDEERLQFLKDQAAEWQRDIEETTDDR